METSTRTWNGVRGLGRVMRRVVRRLRNRPETLLDSACGIIHVGANSGQERKCYARHGLPVLWIEPIPEVFAQLRANVRGYHRQRAYQYLVTDRDDGRYTFHIANNAGASSSILDLHLHRDVWPEVNYERSLELPGITLATLVELERIDLRRYDTLVLDTQGSELLVLRGATPLLGSFRFIQVEAPDFEAYAGGCQVHEIQQFLAGHGFRERQRQQFAAHPSGGGYYDIVFERNA